MRRHCLRKVTADHASSVSLPRLVHCCLSCSRSMECAAGGQSHFQGRPLVCVPLRDSPVVNTNVRRRTAGNYWHDGNMTYQLTAGLIGTGGATQLHVVSGRSMLHPSLGGDSCITFNGWRLISLQKSRCFVPMKHMTWLYPGCLQPFAQSARSCLASIDLKSPRWNGPKSHAVGSNKKCLHFALWNERFYFW